MTITVTHVPDGRDAVWTVVAGPGAWALVQVPAADGRVAALLQAVASPSPLDGMLRALDVPGTGTLPGFAMLERETTGWRYAVREPARLSGSSGGVEFFAGGPESTEPWAEGVLDRAYERIVLAGPEAPGGEAEVPLGLGAFAARRVVVTATETARSRVPPEQPAEPPDIIDGVPWLSSPGAAGPTDDDSRRLEATAPPERTRKRAELPRAASIHTTDHTTAGDPGSGPRIWAAYCPHGHSGPTYAATCRICGAPVPEQQPVQIARPPLGRLRLSTGDIVTLDRDVVLGRSPQPIDSDPGSRAHLVRLHATGISRLHAAVSIDGWQVLLRDLGSSNGTTLALPGGAVQQIRAREDYALEPGSVFTLAGDVSAAFEVTP